MFLLPLVRSCLTSKWSLVTSRRDLPYFDGWANQKNGILELSALKMNLNQAFFLYSSDQLGYVVHGVTASSGYPEAVGLLDDLQLTRPCNYSSEASIFRSSPSPKSESAMLSAESQLQWICDWEQDVSAPTFSVIHIFGDRFLVVFSNKSFLCLVRIGPKIPVKLNSSRRKIFSQPVRDGICVAPSLCSAFSMGKYEWIVRQKAWVSRRERRTERWSKW